jgi:hypothetical protein
MSHIRRPIVKSRVSIISKSPALPPNNFTNRLDELVIKSRSIVNWRREACGIAEIVRRRSELDSRCRSNSVGSFTPPLVRGKTDPARAGRGVDKVEDLLVESEVVDQRGDALRDAERSIADLAGAQRACFAGGREEVGADCGVTFGVVDLQEGHAVVELLESLDPYQRLCTNIYPPPHLLSGSVTHGLQRSSSISFAFAKFGSLSQKHCVPKLIPP